MGAEIYYFSGTGNSLAVARDIADKMKGGLISIPSVMEYEFIKPGADVLGLVFPVYHGGIPNIIRRFAGKLENIAEKYIFGVGTYGDSPGYAVRYLEDMISRRKGSLAAGFGVHLPYNYVTPSSFNMFKMAFTFKLRNISVERQQELFKAWPGKLERILKFVSSGENGFFETSSEKFIKFIDRIGLRDHLAKRLWLKTTGYKGRAEMPFWESIKLMDWGFYADKNCNGCGICAKICPVKNIKMKDNKPSWQHNCEQCFGCLQWCPERAIHFGSSKSKMRTDNYRYHHPYVKISDMLK